MQRFTTLLRSDDSAQGIATSEHDDEMPDLERLMVMKVKMNLTMSHLKTMMRPRKIG